MVDGHALHINSVRDGRVVHNTKQRIISGRLLRPKLRKQPECIPKWQLGGCVGYVPGLGIHSTVDGDSGINIGLCWDGDIGHNKSHGEVLLVLSGGSPPNDAAQFGNLHRELVHVCEYNAGISGTIW